MNRRKPSKEGLWPVLALLIVAAIPALALGYLWKWAGDQETDKVVETEVVAAIPAPLTTPILSFRRAPQSLAAVTSQAALVTELNNVAAFVPDDSCLVVELNGRPILSENGDIKVTPASNQKLLTATVALRQLGPDYRFSTRLMGTVTDGVVDGNLYFVGGGDPLLSTADYPATFAEYAPTNITPLEQLVTNLQAAGVTQINGSIIADESRYDDEPFIDSWAEEIRVAEAGPLGALMVNDSIRPDNGQRWSGNTTPGEGAARVLIGLLTEAGIAVAGGYDTGATPEGTPEITSVTSAPLAAIVGDMLSNSDDNTAELLLKELGYSSDGQGTTASGLNVVNGVLVNLGIDTTQVTLADGSGLSGDNVVTCNILLQVLGAEPLDGPIGAGLAVAGQTGTLYDKFVESPLNGRLHAKTGRLSNVRSLTGFVPTTVGTIEFSMVLNYPNAGDDYQGFWDGLSGAIAPFPSGPTVEQLQPR